MIMNQEIYRSMHTKIVPEEALINKVLSVPVRRNTTIVRKIGATAAAVVLLFGSLRVASSNSEEFRNMLFAISPRAGALFSPVMMSCIDEGIEMTVEGVYVNGDDAEYYITLRDLEGDRIDRTTDLFDSYTIIRPFALDVSSYGCAKEGFDEETGKVRYHIYTHEPGAGKLWGDSITFSLSTILVGVNRVEDEIIPIDLTKIDCNPAMEKQRWSGGGNMGKLAYQDEIDFLVPGAPEELVDEIKLTGIGWKNGVLHIQTYVHNWNGNTSIAFWLEDAEGNRLEEYEASRKEGTRDYKKNIFGDVYTEHMIDVHPEDLENYTIHADWRSGGELIDGDWKVKFPLKSTE